VDEDEIRDRGAVAPDFLTLAEVAAILRIGRSAVYDLATAALRSGDDNQLPVRRVGRQLRVPRALLEAWIGAPITWPIVTPTTTLVRLDPVPSESRTPKPHRRSSQPPLPFAS
jgi:excisionase family DNA binding protein